MFSRKIMILFLVVLALVWLAACQADDTVEESAQPETFVDSTGVSSMRPEMSLIHQKVLPVQRKVKLIQLPFQTHSVGTRRAGLAGQGLSGQKMRLAIILPLDCNVWRTARWL